MSLFLPSFFNFHSTPSFEIFDKNFTHFSILISDFSVKQTKKKMVVLSGAICTKSGKPLVTRQFVEMTRIRIEVCCARNASN